MKVLKIGCLNTRNLPRLQHIAGVMKLRAKYRMHAVFALVVATESLLAAILFAI